MRRRSRSDRSTTSPWRRLATLVVLVGVAVSGGPAATAFTTGDVGRPSSVDVVSDTEATLGVDTASAVHINATDSLVNVTNRLGRDTTITVTLRGDATTYGDLVVNGVNEGDSASFSLARTDTETVRIEIPDNSTYVGESIRFDVRASAPGLHVETDDRIVPIES